MLGKLPILLLMIYGLPAVAQQAVFTAQANADTISPGGTVEIAYSYAITGGDLPKATFDYGITRCTGCKVSGEGANFQSKSISKGVQSEEVRRTFLVTVDRLGIVEIPSGYAIQANGDTIKSNGIKLHVVAGYTRNLYPLLNETQLFSDKNESDPFSVGVEFEAESKLTKVGAGMTLPFLVTAGLVYHRTRPASARKGDVATINRLVQDIVKYMNARPGGAPLGMFLQSTEPRCMFAITDTVGVRQGLDKIYQRYLPMRGYTVISGRDRKFDLSGFSNTQDAWREVDLLVQALKKEHDELSRQRNVYVRVSVPDEKQKKEYTDWALEQGYVLHKSEQITYPKDRLVTELVFIIKADAKSETLFNISIQHRNHITSIGTGCGYVRMGVDKAE